MISDCVSAMAVNLENNSQSGIHAGNFRFGLAKPEDNTELLEFSAKADMPGAIRFSFDRSPDYLAALHVEGFHSDVFICRENKTGRLVATGHRSVKRVFVNGEPVAVGYLGGLRVEPEVRSASFLSRGYTQLREIRAGHPTPFDLTTIMEDNFQARKVLLSARLGLPGYHDFGRFCCMALSLQAEGNSRLGSRLSLRHATQTDAENVVAFLNREGRAKQFFPEYPLEDFGRPDGLLSQLDWTDVFLAFRGAELVGVLAAWDQRAIRRWRVTGYARWLRLSRNVLNLWARLRRMPLLPSPGAPLNYFILSLICIRDNNREVFNALLDEIIRTQQDRYAFFLAGLHERDLLLPELLARPHVSLASRLYVVDWGNDNCATEKLDRRRVPYLELGSL
jgi:hypothetical protein